MKIVNLDSVTAKVVVMTGRHLDIMYVANKIVNDMWTDKFELPHPTTYYQDYPRSIDAIINHSNNSDRRLVIETNSDEFIMCLLESSLEFQLVTVKKEDETYYLRVLNKEEAVACKKAFNMEFRR